MARKISRTGRAWNILRMALLWGRKGGVFKRRLLTELRGVPEFFKNQLGNNAIRRDQIYYGERQLSFDKTPIIHVKMHRPASLRFSMPHIPCINPQVDYDFDYDLGNDDRDAYGYGYDDRRISYLKDREEELEVEEYGYEDDCEHESNVLSEEIDLKAEEFIAKFYQQMKLQRQVSYLEYTDSTQSTQTC